MPRSTNHEGTYRIAGCDLGKSAAKFVVGRVSPGGKLSIEKADLVEHDGRRWTRSEIGTAVRT